MPTKDYHSYLLKRLGDPEYAAMYLKAALDETLPDGERSSFLLALKNVVEAKGTKQSVATESNITWQHLQRLLAENGNPTLETLTSVLQTVGLSIDFKPVSLEE